MPGPLSFTILWSQTHFCTLRSGAVSRFNIAKDPDQIGKSRESRIPLGGSDPPLHCMSIAWIMGCQVSPACQVEKIFQVPLSGRPTSGRPNENLTESCFFQKSSFGRNLIKFDCKWAKISAESAPLCRTAISARIVKDTFGQSLRPTARVQPTWAAE